MCVCGCTHKRERGEEARKERVGRKSGRKESETERKKKQKNPRKIEKNDTNSDQRGKKNRSCAGLALSFSCHPLCF